MAVCEFVCWFPFGFSSCILQSAEKMKFRHFFFQFTCSVVGSERTCSIMIVNYLNILMFLAGVHSARKWTTERQTGRSYSWLRNSQERSQWRRYVICPWNICISVTTALMYRAPAVNTAIFRKKLSVVCRPTVNLLLRKCEIWQLITCIIYH